MPQPSGRKTFWADFFSLAALVVGSISVVVAGFNGFAWIDTDAPWRIAARFGLLISGLLLVLSHVWHWHRNHAETVRLSSWVPKRHFRRLRGYEARARLEPLVVAWGLADPARAGALARLLAETSPRTRVRESQTFTGRTIEWDVEFEAPPAPSVSLLLGEVVLVSNRLKPAHYGKRLAWADGEPLRVASETENRAFMHAVCFAYVASLLVHASPQDRADLLARVADLVTATKPHPRRTRILCDDILARSTVASGPLVDAVVEMLRKADRRAPVFGILPPARTGSTAAPRVLRHNYTSSIKESDLIPDLDWWRRLKDRSRQSLGLPSKFTSFDLGRSLTADSYQLEVGVPPGLYIDEAYVFSNGNRLQKLRRGTFRRSHISWTSLNGRSDLRLSTWRLGDVNPAAQPRLLLRLNEIPPGSVITSTLIASATLLSVWLIGVITGLQLIHTGAIAQSTSAPEPAFDALALATSLPALVTLWWGISQTKAAGIFRSLTALLSMAISLGLTVASIIAYVYRFAAVQEPVLLLPEGKTFYLVQDWVSAVLILIALVNVGFILGLAVSRTARYLQLRAGHTGDNARR